MVSFLFLQFYIFYIWIESNYSIPSRRYLHSSYFTTFQIFSNDWIVIFFVPNSVENEKNQAVIHLFDKS